ncbi:Hpt domain-containing protein [Pontimicrobium sp. IMCC45349]|jgi:HPt (histidine-containing phosphotransfer) domain-containing protein|uniref:Hpt domain-containing protein n=1 Tax=Pontimicrobium sp. IMCC45349 TaxID=3391574 RepID=UPI00399F234D
MGQHYKLDKIRALADNDQEFIETLAMTFLEEVPEDARLLKIAVDSKDYLASYKSAHKMKPTIDLFDLGVLDTLIEVQDWGKFEKKGEVITDKLDIVLEAIDRAVAEIKQDFNL